MRLRRLELAIIGVTLAFAFFMGGFFTGRSWNTVSIMPVATQTETSTGVSVSAAVPEPPGTSETVEAPRQEQPDTPTAPATESPSQVPAPEPVQPEQGPGAPKDSDGRININTASQSELTDLPGIGNVLAMRIVDHRRLYGDFSRIEDLRDVSGIGEKRFEAIADKITVG